jgi:hypothetical protein
MFKFKGAKAGDKIVIETVDNKGKTEKAEEAIK